MKKNCLLILIILLSIHSFGQIGKGDIFISLDGNFMKSFSGSGVTTNEFNSSGKYLEVGSSVEYFFSNHLALGAGLDYQWTKETKYNQIFLKLPDFNLALAHFQMMDTKSHVYLPKVFLKHYILISNKLYFNTKLQFNYGKIMSQYETFIIDSNNSNISDETVSENNPDYVTESSKESEDDFFSAQLGPEINYFITPKFSACLSLGGIEYGMFNWETDNSLWAVNFNPVYWKLGLKIKI
jgi:hypothetical protein